MIRYGNRDNIQIASVARRPIHKSRDVKGGIQIILTLTLTELKDLIACTLLYAILK